MKALFLFFFSLSLAAAVIEAPVLPIDYQQNPASIEWKKIDTEHFELIFPSEVEREAKRVAHILEKAYPFVTRSMEQKPPKIPLVLQNQSVVSNGFVTLAPRRSEWYLTPATDPEITNTEWLKTLAIHEFRHVVQFEKGRRGFNKALYIVLGEVGQALGLAFTLPPWFFEGDAVGIETALTRGGRGRLPLFERDLRTIKLSGQKWDYDKAHLGSYEDYIPNHYVYGYFYTSWLRNEHGDLFLSKLANESAERSWNPLSFYHATDRLTGERFEKFYSRVMSDLVIEWKKRAEKLPLSDIEVKPLPKRFGWTNYLYPQATSLGKIFAVKKGLSFIEQFVLLDGKNEETLYYPAPLHADHPLKVRQDKVAFFEAEVDSRWGYRDYSRLRVLNLKTEEFIFDLRGLKGRGVVLNHDASKLAFIEWNEKQDQSIVIMDMKGRVLSKTALPREQVVTSLDWMGDEDLALVLKDFDEKKWIQKFNPTKGLGEVLLAKTYQNIGHLAIEKGELFFESPESGIDNIYHLKSGETKQITVSKFGAYAPELAGDFLIYNDYSVNGMNIVQKKGDWQSEHKSADSFYAVYEKYSKSENIQQFDSELLVKTSEPEAFPYSQLKNAVNLHSWLLLAPPLSSTVTVVGVSRDILNKLTLTGGALYDLNEQTLQGFTGAVWSHYYPVFDLRAGYGNRRQNVLRGGRDFDNKWEEGTFEAGISVPWQYLQGRFSHSFTARAFAKLIKVTNKLSSDVTDVNDGALFSPGGEFSYSVLSRVARRDLNPSLGFSLDGRFEEGEDVTGNDMKGRLGSLDGRLFLPGLWYHHSFFHQLAFESQDDESYQYSSRIFYPRGTKSAFLTELRKYSANYTMPLFYPDWHWSRYIYLKRVSLNLFYDELNGRLENLSYKAASTGWESIFELYFLRLLAPFNIGVRGSYIINGAPKKENYELFLATNLVQF